MMTREKDERMRRVREKGRQAPNEKWRSRCGMVMSGRGRRRDGEWRRGGKAVEKSHNRMRPVPVRSVQVAGNTRSMGDVGVGIDGAWAGEDECKEKKMSDTSSPQLNHALIDAVPGALLLPLGGRLGSASVVTQRLRCSTCSAHHTHHIPRGGSAHDAWHLSVGGYVASAAATPMNEGRRNGMLSVLSMSLLLLLLHLGMLLLHLQLNASTAVRMVHAHHRR